MPTTKILKSLHVSMEDFNPVSMRTLIQVYVILRPSCPEALVGGRLTFSLVKNAWVYLQ